MSIIPVWQRSRKEIFLERFRCFFMGHTFINWGPLGADITEKNWVMCTRCGHTCIDSRELYEA